MVDLENVTKTYNGSDALYQVTLHIDPGEFVSIVGQSGAGKTTLVKLFIAEERPTSGRIVIGGWDISNIRQREIPILRRQIGVVFQDYKLLPKKTAAENVAFALEVIGAPKRKIEEIVPHILTMVGLGDRGDAFPHHLSGGEQQRVVIARALAHHPKILIADEPTGNLDAINSREIIDLLLKINELKTTVLLVTHDREVVNYVRRRVVALEDGKVVSDKQRGKYVL